MPRKDKNPITSVIVVTKTLEAIAGSIFNFFNVIGTNIPNNPATIMFKTIEIEIIKDNVMSLNQNCTTIALIIANIHPFKTPIVNSLRTFCVKLFFVS